MICRDLKVQLPRSGLLVVQVITSDKTLRSDETRMVAKELREIAKLYEEMSTPEEPK